ncbi:MAG: hypothetical protein V3T08_09915 [Gemmatimonadota bacterium]
MSAHSAQWVEIEVITKRRLKVLVNIVTPDCLEGMTIKDILPQSLGTRAEAPRDSIVIVGTCEEPEEWL